MPEMKELLDDPARFAQVMGFELQPWQVKYLRAMMDPETRRKEIERQNAEPPVYWAEDVMSGVKAPERVTSYTVAEDALARNESKRVLVTWEDVKMVLDKYLKVGQINSRQNDGSKPYAVFNKRDAAVAVAQLVNDRFNAKGQ